MSMRGGGLCADVRTPHHHPPQTVFPELTVTHHTENSIQCCCCCAICEGCLCLDCFLCGEAVEG